MTGRDVEAIVNGYLKSPTGLGGSRVQDAVQRSYVEALQWLGRQASGREQEFVELDMVSTQNEVAFDRKGFIVTGVERRDRGTVPLPLVPVSFEGRAQALIQGQECYTLKPGSILLVVPPSNSMANGLLVRGYDADYALVLDEEIPNVPFDLHECLAGGAIGRLNGQRGVEWVDAKAAMSFADEMKKRFVRFLGSGRPRMIRPSHRFHSAERKLRRWWW